MDMRQLGYFVAAAEDGHLGRAAARLHLSQPALSRQIQLLEKDVKTEPFTYDGVGSLSTMQFARYSAPASPFGGSRTSNGIGYKTPGWGSVTVQLLQGLSEETRVGRENGMGLEHLDGYRGPVQLVMRCIEAEDVGYLAVWGASAHTCSYYDHTGAEKRGYRPAQSAEEWAPEIAKQPNPLDPIAQQFQGGSYVTMNYSRESDDPPAGG